MQFILMVLKESMDGMTSVDSKTALTWLFFKRFVDTQRLKNIIGHNLIWMDLNTGDFQYLLIV